MRTRSAVSPRRPDLAPDNPATPSPEAGRPEANAASADQRLSSLTSFQHRRRSSESPVASTVELSTLRAGTRARLPRHESGETERVSAALPDARITEAQTDEPNSVPAQQTAHLGYEEMRTLSRNVHELAAALTASVDDAVAFHTKLRTELAKHDVNALTDAHLRRVDAFQQHIAMAQPVKQTLDRMTGDLDTLLASDEGKAAEKAAGRAGKIQRAIGMTEAMLAIVAKNAAWYAAPGIIPATGTSFHDVGRMAALVASRSALAMALAATTEYPLATDGQRRYKDAGGQLIRLQGYVQAFDQMAALATMFAVSKATGQAAPPAFQVSGFVLSALGAAMQTGALNDVMLRIVRPISTLLRGNAPRPVEPAFVPIATDGLRAAMNDARPAQPDRVEPAGRDLEQGFGPVARGADPASALQRVLDELHAYPLDRMRSDIAKACLSITNLHDAIFPRLDAQPADDATASAHPAPAPPLTYDAHVERFTHDIDAIRTAALRFRDGLPANDERRVRIDAAFEEAQDTEARIAAMSKDGSPKRAAFFAAMGALSVTGAVLGAIGPAVHDEWLSNLGNRAAIFGVTSSVLQAFANLGQFLGGAQPGDGRLARILKIGMDQENSQTLAWAKNWARSVRFLLGEFPLLQLSTTFSEMSDKEAGRIPEAPAHGIPSAYTIRNVQEAFRAAFSLAFTTMALDETAQWNHLAGLGVSALGAIVPVAVEAGASARR